MRKKKGFTFVELLAVIIVIGIIILIAIPAYSGIKKKLDERAYKNKVGLIETAATKYSEDTRLDVFYVDDLIKNGYLDPDSKDGNILNPINNERLNCYLIRSTENKGVYTSKLSEEKYDDNGVCNENIPATISNSLKIELYDSLTGKKIEYNQTTKWWNKNDVVLRMQVGSTYQDKVAKVEWFEGYSDNVIANSENKNQITISSDSVLQQNYKVKVTLKDGSTLSNVVRVYIDKIKPAFYATDSVETKWVTKLSYDIKAYDNESGLYGYKLIENGASCPTDKKEYSTKRKNTIFENGDKKTCIIDNVGNITEKTFNVANIDNVGVTGTDGLGSSGPSFECNFAVNGTLGNKVSGVQWYKSNTTLTLTPSNVGVSGVSLGISTSTAPQYTVQYTYEQRRNAKVTYSITDNQATTTYNGYIKTGAGVANKCSQTLGVEKSITAPSFTNASISRSSSKITIVVNYSSGNAISGIASTKCELLNTSGTIVKTGTMSGNNCVFDNAQALGNGNYNVRKCITSNAGNSACSTNTGATIGNTIYDIYHAIYYAEPNLYKNAQNQEWHSDCNVHKYKIGSQELSYVEYCNNEKCEINKAATSCDFEQFVQYIGSYYSTSLQNMTRTFGDLGNSNWHVQQYSVKKLCDISWLDSNKTICRYTAAGDIYYIDNRQSSCTSTEVEGGYATGCNVHDWSFGLK